jgi:flagellar biosynthesis chaperone FliJ
MSPGIGLMKRRLEKEKDAIALAISGIMKNYKVAEEQIRTLETKYDDNAGDWYVALGWGEKKAIVKMDSVQGTITEIKEI